MNKQELIKNLKNDIYCRIRLSTIPNAGVGVVAVRDIPKGVCPFIGIPKDEFVMVPRSELKGLDPEVMNLLDDFCVEENGEFYVPKVGLNGMNVSYFLNESTTPNIDAQKFIALRDINKGEELFIHYKDL